MLKQFVVTQQKYFNFYQKLGVLDMLTIYSQVFHSCVMPEGGQVGRNMSSSATKSPITIKKFLLCQTDCLNILRMTIN